MVENIFVIRGKVSYSIAERFGSRGEVSPVWIAEELLKKEILRRSNGGKIRELDIGYVDLNYVSTIKTKPLLPDKLTSLLIDKVPSEELVGSLDSIMEKVFDFVEKEKEDALLVTCHPFNKFENLVRARYGFKLIDENEEESTSSNTGHQLFLRSKKTRSIGYPAVYIEDKTVYAVPPGATRGVPVGKIRHHDDQEYDGYGIVGDSYDYFEIFK